jgi:hypothetical protein
MSKKPDVRGWGYSDDCAGFAPLKTDDSEYDVDGKWYSLFQGEERIGRIRMTYEDGNWEVQLVGTSGKFSLKDDVPVKFHDERVQERIREREEDR